MRQNQLGLYFPVVLSFAVAFVLMLIPLDGNLKWLRPDFVTLVLIFWASTLPNNVGIFWAFTIGILFDLLTGMLIGSMGLTLSVVAFLTLSLRLRLRIYRYWQKFIVIMLLVACSQLIRLWIQMLIGHPPANFLYWVCSFTSALVWPVVYGILNSSNSAIPALNR